MVRGKLKMTITLFGEIGEERKNYFSYIINMRNKFASSDSRKDNKSINEWGNDLLRNEYAFGHYIYMYQLKLEIQRGNN